MSLSIVVNVFPSQIGVIIDAVAFLLIIKGVGILADRDFYRLIGRCIIIAAIFSSVISILQFAVDPYFMRVGIPRKAFGNVIRANGLFSMEYNNSYFLIVAITWVLTTVKKEYVKISLVVLFSIGVLCTFMRMSWLILVLVLFTYLVFIRKTAFEKLMLVGLSMIALVLSVSIFFYQDIMNSSMVKERLADGIEGRYGYFNMVLDNYQKRPILGYGDRNNETYYTQMLLITGSRARASGSEGGIHNGYLETLFYYGVPAMLFFSLYVVLSVYYHGTFISTNFYFVIPFLIGIIVMVCNFTNSFHLMSHPSIMYAIHIGIGIGLRNLEKQSDTKEELVDIF
jgi:O-antigen ligase